MFLCISHNYTIRVNEYNKDNKSNYTISVNDDILNTHDSLESICKSLVSFMKNNDMIEYIDMSDEFTCYGVECYTTKEYIGYLCKLANNYLVLHGDADDMYRLVLEV